VFFCIILPYLSGRFTILKNNREEGAAAAAGGAAPRGPRNNGPLQHDRAASMPSAGTQRFPIQPRLGSELMTDDAVAQQVQPEQGFKDGDGYHGGRDPGSVAGSGAVRQDSGKTFVFHDICSCFAFFFFFGVKEMKRKRTYVVYMCIFGIGAIKKRQLYKHPCNTRLFF
jgi:hypothetical protein